MADPSRLQDDWQSQSFRTKIVNKLEDVMRNSPTQITKSSVEMEEYVFRKARTQEEYLDLVARVLLTIGDPIRERQAGSHSIGDSNAGSAGQRPGTNNSLDTNSQDNVPQGMKGKEGPVEACQPVLLASVPGSSMLSTPKSSQATKKRKLPLDDKVLKLTGSGMGEVDEDQEFFSSLLPTLKDFSDDQKQEFRKGALLLIDRIKSQGAEGKHLQSDVANAPCDTLHKTACK